MWHALDSMLHRKAHSLDFYVGLSSLVGECIPIPLKLWQGASFESGCHLWRLELSQCSVLRGAPLGSVLWCNHKTIRWPLLIDHAIIHALIPRTFFFSGTPIPEVRYTEDETATWAAVFKELTKLYPTHACKQFNHVFPLLIENCGYREDNIPQLQKISDFLKGKLLLWGFSSFVLSWPVSKGYRIWPFLIQRFPGGITFKSPLFLFTQHRMGTRFSSGLEKRSKRTGTTTQLHYCRYTVAA